MDELSTYEEDHSDALRPVQREADQSHAGVAKLVSPLSREEAQLLFEAQELTHREALQKVCFSLTTQIATATAHHHCQCNSQPITNISAVNSSLVPQPSVYTPTPSHVLGLSVPLPLPYPTAPLASTNYPSFSDLNPLKNRRGELIPVPGFGLPNSSQPVENPNRSVSRPAPVAPSRIVPYIPNGECAWRQVIKDWQTSDPSRSLHVPLKDWDKSWYSGNRAISQRIGVQYNYRKRIAEEYLIQYVPYVSISMQRDIHCIRSQLQR